MLFPPLKIDYAGRGGPLFRLALKTGVLTVLTLGIYRFWMKTRMRRYYWSSIRPGGMPLEFTGQPTEMLIGFLVAVVVLSFYIGVVNLVLMFLSFSMFQADAPAYFLSFLGLAPMIFFAQYRSRRYILARTRWRGIRFGQEPGVKGYVWRAALWWTLALASLGVLWPLKTFALEKYRTDRTWWGSEKFTQHGSVWSLMRSMVNVYIAVALIVVGTVIGVETEDPAWALMAVMGALWLPLGLAYWRADSFRRLMERRSLGGAGFRCRPRAGRILGIYIGGGLAITALVTALLIGFGFVLAIGLSIAETGVIEAGVEDLADLADIPAWAVAFIGIAAYFSVFLFWGVLKEVFLTLPVARHLAETTEIVNAEALAEVRQRARDEFAEAEGFADALPLGDGI